MALGANIQTVTITGNYVDYEGTAIQGQVRFSLDNVLRSAIDDQLVAPSTAVVALSAGAFSVTLPATNDPDVIPNPFVYEVEESFPGGRTYNISIPYDSAGALDLADLSPTPTLSETFVQLVDETTWESLTDDIDDLDDEINQTTDRILASGKYWYIDAQFASYTALDSAYATYTALTAGVYELEGSDISGFVTLAESAESAAEASKNLAQTNDADTINPLLLIGG